MRTFDYPGETTAADLCRLFLLGDGHGPAADLAEAYGKFHAFCNGLPAVGVPSRREFADGLLRSGCRLVLDGDFDAAETYARYRRLYGVGRRAFVDDAFRRGCRIVLPDDAEDPVVGT
jgi:hypothetical protein